ncbi:type IV pilus biogenesis protein PilP [bacterium]|nr:type IV pilus biogenesis protein PilP [bacterium]
MRKKGVFWIAGMFVALGMIIPSIGLCEEQQKQAEESKKIYDTKPLIKLEEEISTEEKQLKLLEIKAQKKKYEIEIRGIEAQMQDFESTNGGQAGRVYQRQKIRSSQGKEGEDVNWLSKAYLKMVFKKQNVNYAMISFNDREITVKEGDLFEGYKVEKIATDYVVIKAGKIIERISW